VCPKWFVSLWCIRRELCTYLAPKLKLSQMERSKIRYDTHHLVISGASKLISEHMVLSRVSVRGTLTDAHNEVTRAQIKALNSTF